MDKEPVLIKVIQLGTLFLVNEESIYYLLQEKKIYMHPLRKYFIHNAPYAINKYLKPNIMNPRRKIKCD